MSDPAARQAWLEKMRSVGVIQPTGARVREYRRGDGVRVKETLDEHGNITRLHNTGDTERADAEIRPATIVRKVQ